MYLNRWCHWRQPAHSSAQYYLSKLDMHSSMQVEENQKYFMYDAITSVRNFCSCHTCIFTEAKSLTGIGSPIYDYWWIMVRGL